MERQLGLAPGDGVSGIAEWLVGSPPISLLLEEFLVPGNLRQGLPAPQVPYTLLHLVGPPCRTNGRPERIFIHNPNPGRDKGKGKGKGNQAKRSGQRQRRAREAGNGLPVASVRHPPRPGHPPPNPAAGAGVPNQANVPAPAEGQVEQQQAGVPPEPTAQLRPTRPCGERKLRHRLYQGNDPASDNYVDKSFPLIWLTTRLI